MGRKKGIVLPRDKSQKTIVPSLQSLVDGFAKLVCFMNVRPPGISMANSAMFFPLFFIMFDISKAGLHYRQTIYGNRLGKWDLAVDVEKEEEGNKNEHWIGIGLRRSVTACDVSLWNTTDHQRRLLRFKSKLICYDLLLRINNLAQWLIQKGDDKIYKIGHFLLHSISFGAYVQLQRTKGQGVPNQQLGKICNNNNCSNNFSNYYYFFLKFLHLILLFREPKLWRDI